MVELVMHVYAVNDRLSGSVRVDSDVERYRFSGTLELMRVFEQLAHNDPPANEQERP